jgi:hypothetical protein
MCDRALAERVKSDFASTSELSRRALSRLQELSPASHSHEHEHAHAGCGCA